MCFVSCMKSTLTHMLWSIVFIQLHQGLQRSNKKKLVLPTSPDSRNLTKVYKEGIVTIMNNTEKEVIGWNLSYYVRQFYGIQKLHKDLRLLGLFYAGLDIALRNTLAALSCKTGVWKVGLNE